MSFLDFPTNSYISATVYHSNPYITLGWTVNRIGLLQQTTTWYKIRHTGGPWSSLLFTSGAYVYVQGHQNKGQSSLTGWGLFVLTSQCENDNELALQHGGLSTMRSFAAKGLLTQPSPNARHSWSNHKWVCFSILLINKEIFKPVNMRRPRKFKNDFGLLLTLNSNTLLKLLLPF